MDLEVTHIDPEGDLIAQLPMDILTTIVEELLSFSFDSDSGNEISLLRFCATSKNIRSNCLKQISTPAPLTPQWELFFYRETHLPLPAKSDDKPSKRYSILKDRIPSHMNGQPKPVVANTSRFFYRHLPTAQTQTPEEQYPFTTEVSMWYPEKESTFDHKVATTSTCRLPLGIHGLSEDKKDFDARHDEVIITTGRYCHVPVTHPYTVTNPAQVCELHPTVEGIKCLFLLTPKPMPNLKRLDINYVLSEDYVICSASKSSAVYECGKSYGSFRQCDRGLSYLHSICPNLEILRVSYPHVDWSDMSAPRKGGMNLTGKNAKSEVYAEASRFHKLEVLIVDELHLGPGNEEAGSTINTYYFRRKPEFLRDVPESEQSTTPPPRSIRLDDDQAMIRIIAVTSSGSAFPLSNPPPGVPPSSTELTTKPPLGLAPPGMQPPPGFPLGLPPPGMQPPPGMLPPPGLSSIPPSSSCFPPGMQPPPNLNGPPPFLLQKQPTPQEKDQELVKEKEAFVDVQHVNDTQQEKEEEGSPPKRLKVEPSVSPTTDKKEVD